MGEQGHMQSMGVWGRIACGQPAEGSLQLWLGNPA
jgi:hypothetical protein